MDPDPRRIVPIVPLAVPAAVDGDGVGCHSGGDAMREAARQAGKSDVLDQYAKDYPLAPAAGPHDQPQSMCPAFGSLRVGLRMRRTATILSGSACCVYGLTFTSHFYGAKRSVGYVPFNSESLVTGKLFEDIRDAVHQQADPALYDAIVVINLCVPTASGVPLQILPKAINGVRIIGIDVPGFGVPTHAEAKDVLAGAMLRYARGEAEQGPVAAPRAGRSSKPTVTLLGEMFPADPMVIGMMLEPMGLAAGPVVPTREWRELYAALDGDVVAAIHPFYTASVREFEAAGRPVVGSAPVGHRRHRGVAAGDRHGRRRRAGDASTPRRTACCRRSAARSRSRRSAAASRCRATKARSCSSAACSSRAARTCATSAPPVRGPPGTPKTAAWLEANGVRVQFRASLQQDLAAMDECRPDLAIGTTPVVQAAKEACIPALYFTNLISARPLMGPAGAGSLAQVVNAAIANKPRFETMRAFFEDAGHGHAAGVWEGVPQDRPEWKAFTRHQVEKLAKKRRQRR